MAGHSCNLSFRWTRSSLEKGTRWKIQMMKWTIKWDGNGLSSPNCATIRWRRPSDVKITWSWIDCELCVWQSEKTRLAIVSSSGYRLGHPRLSNLHFLCEALDGSMYSQATSSSTYCWSRCACYRVANWKGSRDEDTRFQNHTQGEINLSSWRLCCEGLPFLE